MLHTVTIINVGYCCGTVAVVGRSYIVAIVNIFNNAIDFHT